MTQVVVGLGLTREATIDEVRATVEKALKSIGLEWDDVITIATTVRRRDHPAVRALIEAGDEALVLFEPSDLARVTVPNPSAAVGQRAGTTSVAEAAALLAAHTDVLRLPKQTTRGVSVAVSEAAGTGE